MGNPSSRLILVGGFRNLENLVNLGTENCSENQFVYNIDVRTDEFQFTNLFHGYTLLQTDMVSYDYLLKRKDLINFRRRKMEYFVSIPEYIFGYMLNRNLSDSITVCLR